MITFSIFVNTQYVSCDFIITHNFFTFPYNLSQENFRSELLSLEKPTIFNRHVHFIPFDRFFFCNYGVYRPFHRICNAIIIALHNYIIHIIMYKYLIIIQSYYALLAIIPDFVKLWLWPGYIVVFNLTYFVVFCNVFCKKLAINVLF